MQHNAQYNQLSDVHGLHKQKSEGGKKKKGGALSSARSGGSRGG